MAWNPYTDQKNRAYSGILTTLFPEQTKTLPRIIVWSVIFLIDLILGVLAAVHFGLLQFGSYRSTNEMNLAAALLIAGIIGVFWLQGVIWGAITKLYNKKKEIE